MYVIHNMYFHNSEFMHSNYRVPSYRQTIRIGTYYVRLHTFCHPMLHAQGRSSLSVVPVT